MSGVPGVGPVRDNKALNRFELEMGGITAFLNYRRAGGIVTFIHEEVPKAFEGRGLGSALAKGALDLVRGDGEKIIAACPFIATYIRKHPEYRDLLTKPLT
jgi:predicted GNAT family acetyltransferase